MNKRFSESRRQFLRASGVALALPALESLQPVGARRCRAAETARRSPKRLLAVCNNLGLLPDRFFPSDAGQNYKLSPYLEELSDLRAQFTVFSGVSHPGVDGSHASDVSFLTAAPHPGSGGFRNSISLDQLVASKIGTQTRYASLSLGVNARQGRRGLSFTDSGALLPCEDSASNVFKKLYVQGSPHEVEQQIRKLRLGESILDAVRSEAKSVARRLSKSDQVRLDQYATSVREVERRLLTAQQWERRPKPEPPIPSPVDPPEKSDYMEKTRLMYQMARLAFESDSTRSISLLLDSNNSPTIDVAGTDITDGYHNLSHHGKSDSKLQQLDAIDRNHMQMLGQLLSDLSAQQEGGDKLLDNTIVLYGSNLGDANKHTTTNMPVLLAGGGFRHGQHLVFDREDNYPLPNLFVSILQQMGIESDRFASSTGTLRGLDLSAT